MQTKQHNFLIGTYTENQSKGIYRATFDSSNGKIQNLSLITEIESPSFLSLDNNQNLLAVSETENGQIIHFQVQKNSNNHNIILNKKFTVPTQGSCPCYVSILNLSDSDKELAMVSNYMTGNNIIVNLQDQSNQQILQHTQTQKSFHPRQENAHAHCIQQIENTDIVLSCDLGCDQIYQYRVKQDDKQILELESKIECPKQSGPRHLNYDPENKLLYVVGELNSTVIIFKFEENKRIFTLKNQYSTLTNEQRQQYDQNLPSHILRQGADTISVFQINPQDYSLKMIQNERYGGIFPRHFEFSPCGNYILIANQQGNNINVIKLTEGKFENINTNVEIQNPAFILFEKI
ncbi:Cytochrome cd1-nitrite reductase-like, heme d1 domain [Pseudocohnilembus persalinus]|uniref:Cytochrome cd1-nitrite reductase-like, heme d1 domain n=1 Tax=Pseudocohnilembus persalinus TaxID=266149 RepID=A0A0V0R2L9_PSEPJ|nr:Cytochrome cd1-nitrite reductase-like, heme d1 domain [Pseudocohnilembus persalinus]|eukprot:KRX08761.1 Cytochrome cd1-nitrite reductase-like, heme d1 domain [Pseudocohnilembus persalinus]